MLHAPFLLVNVSPAQRMQVLCRSGDTSCVAKIEAGALLTSCCAKQVLKGNAPFTPCSVHSAVLLFPACNTMQHPQEHDFAWMLRVRGLPERMPPEGKPIKVRQSAQLGDFQDFFFTSAACCYTCSYQLKHLCKQLWPSPQPPLQPADATGQHRALYFVTEARS